MKQTISVRAIIKNDNKTLLFKRSVGRESDLGKYELPGGRLEYGEQPEDALKRHLEDNVGVLVQTTQLFDAVTYINHNDRDIQRVIIVYLVSLQSKNINLPSGHKYGHYVWSKLSEPQRIDMTNSTNLILDISQNRTIDKQVSVKEEPLNSNDVNESTTDTHLILYSDGGSRGNPGPSAAGFVVLNSEESVIFEGGEYLGITTNNQSEYHGVRLGLEKAFELKARRVDFRIDSLLVVNQMNGMYKIKNRELWPINERIRELVGRFDKVTFTHVRREYNQLADNMVNKILDTHKANDS